MALLISRPETDRVFPSTGYEGENLPKVTLIPRPETGRVFLSAGYESENMLTVTLIPQPETGRVFLSAGYEGENMPKVTLIPRPETDRVFLSAGYDGENLLKVLKKVSQSTVVLIDRWHIVFSTTEDEEKGDPIPYNIINNYFSIGVVSIHLLPFRLMTYQRNR